MYHIVYLTTNIVNQKIYVGVHSTYNLDDGYLGSGKTFLKAISKYGVENFKQQILFYCLTDKDAYEIERQIVNDCFIINPNNYNIVLGGKCGNLNKTYDELYGLEKSNLIKQKISNGNKGKICSTATKLKLSIKHKGKKLSLAHRQKLQRPFTEEHKQKLRESRKGIIFSNEHKKNLSIATTGKNNPMYGKERGLKYLIVTPENTQISCKNLNDVRFFVKTSPNRIISIVSGIIDHFNGYQIFPYSNINILPFHSLSKENFKRINQHI